MILREVPLAPDGDEARRWLQDELSKAAYANAQPTLFDRVSQGFLTWFVGLFHAGRSGVPTVLLVVGVIVVVALVVTAVLLFGVPRRNRRSGIGSLFGEEDRRSAADLRRSAEAAAARQDWRLAVLERFRAIARGLDERTLVEVFPGTTATGFARVAARSFASERGELTAAAALFDAVRYADRPADRVDAERLTALDARLVAARPTLPSPVGA